MAAARRSVASFLRARYHFGGASDPPRLDSPGRSPFRDFFSCPSTPHNDELQYLREYDVPDYPKLFVVLKSVQPPYRTTLSSRLLCCFEGMKSRNELLPQESRHGSSEATPIHTTVSQRMEYTDLLAVTIYARRLERGRGSPHKNFRIMR